MNLEERRAAMINSLENPHPDAVAMAEEGLAEWHQRIIDMENDLTPTDDSGILDPKLYKPVKWIPGKGWRMGGGDMSESINELAKALVAFHGDGVSYKKGAVNPHFKNRYTTLEDLVDAVTPVLQKHGLAVSQFPTGDGCLTTYLMHASGQYVSHETKMFLAKTDPQGLGSAITYARRNSLAAVLGIAADVDDDAEKAMVRPAPSAASKKTPSW